MADTSYRNADEARRALRGRLGRVVGREFADLLSNDDALLRSMVELTQRTLDTSDGSLSHVSPDALHGFDIRWVVRDADCDLLEALGSGMSWLVGAGGLATILGGTSMTPAMGIGAVVGIFLFLRKYYKSQVPVSDVEMQILLALKCCSDGATDDEIKRILVQNNRRYSNEELIKAMNSLQAMRKNDGEVVALINKAADGKWSVAGI
jgi:hypothetical protein